MGNWQKVVTFDKMSAIKIPFEWILRDKRRSRFISQKKKCLFALKQ